MLGPSIQAVGLRHWHCSYVLKALGLQRPQCARDHLVLHGRRAGESPWAELSCFSGSERVQLRIIIGTLDDRRRAVSMPMKHSA